MPSSPPPPHREAAIGLATVAIVSLASDNTEAVIDEMFPAVQAMFADPEVDPQKMAVSLAYMVAELVGQVADADRMPVMDRWRRFLAARETAR